MGLAQRQYESQLRKVGRIVGKLTATKPLGDLADLLKAYAEALKPWAQRTAWRMLQDVDQATFRTWSTLSEEISTDLKRQVAAAPVRPRLMQLLQEQVEGIKSVPLRAAQRVEKLALEYVTEGRRFDEIAEQLQRSGAVSESDAVRLARTSVSGAATALVQSRAEWIGSEGYIWETARDHDVRPEHKALQGKFIRWDDPPTIDGYTAHAGQFANCRCWPRPVLPVE